jgi:hypothetical protein
MKNTLLLILLLPFTAVWSQSFPSRLSREVQDGKISPIQAAYLAGVRISAPDRLPAEYREDPGLPVKSGLSAAYSVRHHRDRFTATQKADLAKMMARPALPFSLVSPTGLFRIHYTQSGVDAVPPADYDLSGVPDYVEETAAAFDYVYQIEVNTLDFQPPVSDSGMDGNEWDVYIFNIPGAYGYTMPEQRDPSNTKAWIAYISVDNDYTHTPTRGLEGLKVTAAHEFFHMIQLAYHGRDDDGNGMLDDLWLMEAGSTWMEDVVYDHINDYYYYLAGFFNENNKPLDTVDGWREYGLCIWNHFLEQRLGGREFALSTWEHVVDMPAMEATAQALREAGRDFGEEMTWFYGWNYMTGMRADVQRYYPEGASYPMVRIDSTAVFTGESSITGSVECTAAKYYRLELDDDKRCLFVPTNTDWTGGSAGSFTLIVTSSPGTGNYTEVSSGLFASLSPDPFMTGAVFEEAGLALDLQVFGASEAGLDTDDLPQAYPQPFNIQQNDKVYVPFILEQGGPVEMWIYTASGSKVRYVESFIQNPGTFNKIEWDGRDEEGRTVPGGVYVYVVQDGDGIVRRGKIAVVR